MYTRFVPAPRVVAFLIGVFLLAPAAGVRLGAVAAENAPGPVRVSVVVTDAKEQPVAGLKPADFQLLVDGQPQTVETAERARPGATPRLFVFLLDEFHTAAADGPAVRDALLRFVDTRLSAADATLVVKPLDPLTSFSPSTDRDLLRRALSAFEGRKGDYAPRTDFERQYMAQAPAAVAASRAQIVTSALRAAAAAVAGGAAGRPVIVLVSDGFDRARTSRDLPASLQAAVRVANRADAPVYAFAPGLTPPPEGDAADPAFQALHALASQTGGVLVTGRDGLERGLARMMRDLDTHYVLSWQPPHGADGRFHAVRVDVRRAGARARVRAGYVVPEPAPPARTAAEPAVARRILRRSALIQSWGGFVPIAPGRGLVTLTWEPAAPRAGTPAAARASTVVVTASAPDGGPLFDAPLAPATAPPGGVPNIATFEAPLGTVRIDMKILDDKGVVIDTDARDMAPPGVRTNVPTIYPPAVIRTRTAREFRDASAGTPAAPVATRDFRRTDRLVLRVPAVDAAGNAVPTEAVLLNRWRQPMRALTPLEPAALPNVTQYDLPLAPLAPGEYSVRITAAGPGGTASEYVTFRVQG